LKEYPDRFGFSVSHTTRAPRGAEQDGREYHFVTKDNFLKLVDAGGFIEHAQFGSNYYGTSVQAVKDVAQKNRTCILDIEMEVSLLRTSFSQPCFAQPILAVPCNTNDESHQGVKQVKKTNLNARFLSLQPPSLEILEKRLRGRATDSEDAITQRLTQAKHELEFANQPGVFDKVIINDDLEKAWSEFKAFCLSD